jgi:hypothetical protein
MNGASPSSLVVIAASSVAVAALACWLFGAAEVAEPGPPTGLLGPVLESQARLPALGPLARYDVNDANPFVPASARMGTPISRIDHDQDPQGRRQRPPVPIDPPTMSLPLAPPLRRASFGCVGVVAANGRETLLVRMPTGVTRSIAVGESVADGAATWALEALEPGGIARFRDGAGAVERLPVGDSIAFASARSLSQ